MAKKRRRVLVVNHFASPHGHAGGTRHAELFGRVEGWEHLILGCNRNYLTGEKVASSQGFRAIPVPAHSGNSWRRVLGWCTFAWGAVKVGAREDGVSVVYASSPHLLSGLAGWLLATLKRVPFVLEIRDLWPRILLDMGQLTEASLTYRALVRLEEFLYSQADTIVVMAEGTSASLIRRGVIASKITYIPNGADVSDFVPSKSRDYARRQYGFSQFTAVYAGAHGPANGLHLVLEAADAIRRLPISIVLVGGGVAKDGLVALAGSRELRNVRFLDPLAKTEIPDLLTAADVGLHVLADVDLFRSAVSPNKIFDYMAAGTPILTNCPGVVGDLVTTAESGIVVPANDLASGLKQLYESESKVLRRYGERGSSWINENQSRTEMASRLESVLDFATCHRGPSRRRINK